MFTCFHCSSLESYSSAGQFKAVLKGKADPGTGTQQIIEVWMEFNAFHTIYIHYMKSTKKQMTSSWSHLSQVHDYSSSIWS